MPLIPGHLKYPDLPIVGEKIAIIEALQNSDVLILAGETGSGKTTQLPKLCIEAGFGKKGKIACTQPRRVAAYSVAERIAEECAVTLGKEVGFKVRFNDKTSPETVIKVMTDGVLLMEIQSDPLLSQYEVIIIDEAHERSLNIDFLIGYLRQLRIKRPQLKVVVTSATLDMARFAEAFSPATIINVEGRMYPVEVIYAPVEANEKGEGGYLESAAGHITTICEQKSVGDILVFLTGERDIRELRQILDKKNLGHVAILPLLGRLSQSEQHRIFEKTNARKIILATNIAETSLTITGIRYVIDAGWVRMSRYSPQTRTKRLPIEVNAQSSARQRQGRAGRVSEGVCIRLYSEAEFYERPLYPQPEIQRANLADVILRMVAFKLGNISTFPFIEPPQERAIQAGYQLLRELGAIDDAKELTEIGQKLARLPVDPTVARILLEAKKYGVLEVVVVIAAALSIQDPRERPFDEQAKADASHKRFLHPDSDFLTLWNIWQAYHGVCEKMSQRALRKFCKAHYLSYLRMREWMDIHDQLRQALKDLNIFISSVGERSELDYDSIHKSLLVGFLTQVAHKLRGNTYQATHNRSVVLFPGSGIFEKAKSSSSIQKKVDTHLDKSKTPEWILCAEWMQTSQVFARTVAKIQPEWVLAAAEHIIKRTYVEPYWDAKKGRVLVKEKNFLHGLLLIIKAVGYASVNPEEACDIFIREALMPHAIIEYFEFLDSNQKIYQEAEDYYHRLRLSGDWILRDRLYDFYKERVRDISSVAQLYRYVRNPESVSLNLKLEDLIDPQKKQEQRFFYPSTYLLGEKNYEIMYLNNPESGDDGVLLNLDLAGCLVLKEWDLEWLVPGHYEAYIESILKALPKESRRQLGNLGIVVKKILITFKSQNRTRKSVIKEYLKTHYHIDLGDEFWKNIVVDRYLLPKLKVFYNEICIIQGREWSVLQPLIVEYVDNLQLGLVESDQGKKMWNLACQSFEKQSLTDWNFGDIPRFIEIGLVDGIDVKAYPGLEEGENGVALKLFKEEIQAQRASVAGYRKLLRVVLQKDLQLFKKELKVFERIGIEYMSLGSVDDLKQDIYSGIENEFIDILVPWPMKVIDFQKQVTLAQGALRGLPLKILDHLKTILKVYYELLHQKNTVKDLLKEVHYLIYPHFLRYTPFEHWFYLERYLKAIQVRNSRRLMDPQKDLQRFNLIKPWVNAIENLEKRAFTGLQKRKFLTYRWAVEVYKVSVFAQDLGVPFSISSQKLEVLLQQID